MCRLVVRLDAAPVGRYPMNASPLAAWQSYYVIIGSSAAALTGLQFVVMALISESSRKGGSEPIAAFGTPTVVHFCVALLVAAIACAPWATATSPAIAIGCCGAGGVAYATLVGWRAQSQRAYRPVLEDWIWHVILPVVAYAALLVAAVLLRGEPGAPPFIIAAAALLLVFIGIHNAWDSAMYIAGGEQSTTAERAPLDRK
ncbi:MAG: hypothetical protein ACREK8_05640 [Gemmatimonadales bacterium]